MPPMRKALTSFLLLTFLQGCSLVSTQAVYEEIRAQQRSKDAGSGAAPVTKLPPYDQYQKERSVLSPQTR